ncbi:MAG: hypothetical protein E7211_08865 [Clostridium lundense]|nr:hypothetical protein [Clostridium lundense]
MAIKDIDSLTIDDMRPITVSFKKNEDELTLYKWILKHSGYSGFMKDILRKEMNGETKEASNIKIENASNSLIELDF